MSLALLLALTLLALAASQATRNQTQFVSAIRERDIAFQAAEAALRAGERLVSTSPVESCVGQRCRIYAEGQLGQRLAKKPAAWWRNHAWAYTTSDAWTPWSEELERNSPAADVAAFVIEEYSSTVDSLALSPDGSTTGTAIYRITAAAPTPSGRPLIVLQSMFVALAPIGESATSAQVPLPVLGAADGMPEDDASGPALGRQSWRQLL